MTRLPLHRDAEFSKLWTGYTIARLGSQVTVLALPLTALVAQMAPAVIAGLFIGVWVDRLPRRPILIVSDIGSAIVIGSIPLGAALGALTLGQLYVVAFLGGTFAIATELARGAFVPSLVGRDRLVEANSRLQASNAVSQVAGPSLGGILVQALSAPTAMLVDAATFVVSAAFIATIRTKEALRPRERERSVWHEIAEDLRFLYRHPILFRRSRSRSRTSSGSPCRR